MDTNGGHEDGTAMATRNFNNTIARRFLTVFEVFRRNQTIYIYVNQSGFVKNLSAITEVGYFFHYAASSRNTLMFTTTLFLLMFTTTLTSLKLFITKKV